MDIKPKLENIDLGEVLGLGAALALPKHAEGVEGKPYTALPQGWQLHDLEKFLPAPLRATGRIAFGDADSFSRYVNKHKDAPGAASAAAKGVGNEGADHDDMQTVLLVDVIASKFRAVFDSNASDAPGWGAHTADYNCPLSPQWALWTRENGKSHSKDQEDFAFFIEQNQLDVIEPVGTTMLQIVTTLKAIKKVQFDSGIRLQNGQHQLKYHEDIGASAGEQGELQIPEKIALGIPVYVGQAPYRVEAFLRYRIERGSIVFWYDLITPDRILEDALSKVRVQIEGATGIKAYAVASL